MLHASRAQTIVFAVLLMLLATPFSSMVNSTDDSQSNFTDESLQQVSARAQTTWSGTQTLTS